MAHDLKVWKEENRVVEHPTRTIQTDLGGGFTDVQLAQGLVTVDGEALDAQFFTDLNENFANRGWFRAITGNFNIGSNLNLGEDTNKELEIMVRVAGASGLLRGGTGVGGSDMQASSTNFGEVTDNMIVRGVTFEIQLGGDWKFVGSNFTRFVQEPDNNIISTLNDQTITSVWIKQDFVTP